MEWILNLIVEPVWDQLGLSGMFLLGGTSLLYRLYRLERVERLEAQEDLKEANRQLYALSERSLTSLGSLKELVIEIKGMIR